MEVKLTTGSGGYRGGRPRVYLCSYNLRRKVEFPVPTETIYAVFTKQRGPDSFAIRVNSVESIETTGLAGFYGALTFDTKTHLYRNYKRGYRYVHVEYDA